MPGVLPRKRLKSHDSDEGIQDNATRAAGSFGVKPPRTQENPSRRPSHRRPRRRKEPNPQDGETLSRMSGKLFARRAIASRPRVGFAHIRAPSGMPVIMGSRVVVDAR